VEAAPAGGSAEAHVANAANDGDWKLQSEHPYRFARQQCTLKVLLNDAGGTMRFELHKKNGDVMQASCTAPQFEELCAAQTKPPGPARTNAAVQQLLCQSLEKKALFPAKPKNRDVFKSCR